MADKFYAKQTYVLEEFYCKRGIFIIESSYQGGIFNGKTSMKPKVLCVDDQYGIRLLLKEILKSDYDVMTVETGEEAIESVLKFEPHVLILDMKLEKMKGTDLLKKIRQINCNISTIILTGYQDYDLINEIKQSNPEKIIIKPFVIEQIRNSVKELISKFYESNTD